MSTVSNLTVSYSDYTIEASLSTGETITIDLGVDYNGLAGEELAQAELRISKLFSKLLNSNLTVLKSVPDITELP